MDSQLQKRDTRLKTTRSLGYLPTNLLPIDALEPYLLNCRQNAARIIQAAWRGHRCRKTFKENKNRLKETKAAIIIQRSVREWLHKKKNTEFLFKTTDRNIYCLEKVNESRIPELQAEINRWNETNNANFESHEKLQVQLGAVQEQLKSFYEKAATRRTRMARCEALCAQIEAIASLLTDLPALVQCDRADISALQTPVVSDARAARRRHKQQLKAYAAPWWKRLNLQTENIV